MNKDIIYIDVEDDITAIIGKVKDAKEKIVALVPPKRIGILQSAVNLRLLVRAAEQSNKRLVLISNNSALMALAAAAKIPVAKNLQSKPSMAEIPALEVDDGEDVIDGAQLPVGELARTADAVPLGMVTVNDPAVDEAVRENAAEATSLAVPPPPGATPLKPRTKSNVSIPNFGKFRKKLGLIIGGAVVLVGLLVWAILFAPHAKIMITARTTDASVNSQVALNDSANTDLASATLKTTTQEIKKDVSLNFDATGTKKVGEKATGTIQLSNNSLNDRTVAGGTTFTASNGTQFTSDGSVTVPAAYLCSDNGTAAVCAGTKDVSVTAADIGSDYNVGPQTFQTPAPVDAQSTAAMSGGSSHEAKVVTDQDVQKALDKLSQDNADDVKKQLASQFNNAVVIDQTFNADRSAAKPNPAVGAEATDGTGKLEGTVTYSIMGVGKDELGHYLDDYFTKQLDGANNQRIYDNGVNGVSFANVDKVSADGYTATLVATAQIGPKIDDAAIKTNAKGKRYGEIQSGIESISGVDNVDIKFSPFWVSQAPNDTKRISVEFKLDESK